MASGTLILIGRIYNKKILIFKLEKNDRKKNFDKVDKNCI